jgi:endo-1,4-beta-xylanase
MPNLMSRLGAAAVCLFAGASSLSAQPVTIVQNDWEDGTLQGWIPRGGTVVLTNTTEVAHAGTHSLKTTGRTAGFNGPSLNILPLLVSGATYQITASVRLVTGTPATQLSITVQRTVNGANNFDSVVQSGATAVTDSAWTTLTGLYSYTGTAPSGLLLYVESASATASYYVDDFSIVLAANPPGPPPNTNGLSTGFESGTREGWTPRIGTESVNPSSADAHSGTFSLLTTGRTAAFQGPAINVTNIMFNGSRYVVSVWAKLAPGEPSSSLRVSLQRNIGTITTFHTVVGNTTVTAGAWVQLSTTYDMALANTSVTLYVESSAGTASFYIDDASITFVPPPTVETNLASLGQVLSPYVFVGAAVNATTISGVHGDLLSKHFNSITSENDMKWDATEPTEGTFTFANADAQVSFAKAHGMRVRGHTLVWHNQIPAWVFTDPATGATMTPSAQNKALLLQRLRNHIQGLLTHFGTDVYAWDVVNEAVDPAQTDCLRRSTWYTITGKDFIDTAFQAARQFAPNAELFYNDFSTTDTAKRQCIFNLVADLKSRGIPIDAVGHQMHINLNYPGVQPVLDTVNQFATLGIDQQFTEMDISVGTTFTSYAAIPPSVISQQGYEYRDYLNAVRLLQGKLSSVTFWGMADDHTWLTSGTVVDAPLPFDTSLHAKPAYWGIVDQSQLPGIGLTGTLTAKAGAENARVWTLTLANAGPGTAYGTQLSGFTLIQTSGAACTPVIQAQLPAAFGDIAPNASANANVTIDFTGCSAVARFSLNAPFSSSNGWNAGAIIRNNEFR